MTEMLFEAEAELRAAALDYASVQYHPNAHGEHRRSSKALREAARKYALIAVEIDEAFDNAPSATQPSAETQQ